MLQMAVGNSLSAMFRHDDVVLDVKITLLGYKKDDYHIGYILRHVHRPVYCAELRWPYTAYTGLNGRVPRPSDER